MFVSAQLIETIDDLICLTTAAPMELDSLYQVARPSVVEEEDSLPNTPERSRSELIGACATLGDAVREADAHVVHENVGEEVHRLVGERSARDGRGAARNHLASGKRRRVAVDVGWGKQITAALETVQYLVLVMTPAAVVSEESRREWPAVLLRFAVLKGKQQNPLLGKRRCYRRP